MAVKPRTKKQTAVIKAHTYPVGGDGSLHSVREDNTDTLGHELVRRVRTAGAFTTGDQVPPAAILWPDGDRRWECVLPELRKLIPELFTLGDYNPQDKTGPAIWLRCVEARTLDAGLPDNKTPVFYLPGIGRQELRAVEECPDELGPLVELQFRGAVWSHPNGRDWTPYAFLSSEHGGLNLNVSSDAATAEALGRSLSVLLRERLWDLVKERIDSQYLNTLLSPDLPVEILRWMNDPATEQKRKDKSAWQAFRDQCRSEYKFDPEKDGELRAAEFLGLHEGNWGKVWKRFAEAPNRYPGVPPLLEKATPPMGETLGLDREYWPFFNNLDEAALVQELLALRGRPAPEAAEAILGLEKKHGVRRSWVWREVGMAPLAVALEHLAVLASMSGKALAAPDAVGMADKYAQDGWETDAAAVSALAAGKTPESDDAIFAAVRSLYLPWLDESARNLQHFAVKTPESLKPRLAAPQPSAGQVVLFVDGLRMDLARRLARILNADKINPQVDWDWAAFPTVTPTGKAAISPMAAILTGGGPEEEFAPSTDNGKSWTSDRFQAFLKEKGIQNLQGRDCGDHTGRAWAEAGTIDSRGHNEGVKTVKMLEQELKDIAGRIRELMAAGWREIIVVTDHGWLLVPGGLPKAALSHFTVEHRWGRCAAVKTAAATDLPSMPWHWNSAVTIATPPGAACFRAGMEYAHGGLSVQEIVVPRLTIHTEGAANGLAKITGVKWVGLRCRVSVENAASGMKSDVRGRQADPKSSKVEGGKPREIGSDGTVSLPLSDDRDEGNAAVVVLLAPDGTVINAIPTVIGVKP